MTSPLSRGHDANAEGLESTSISLLERAKVFDLDAWGILVDLYGPLAYQWCRRWGLPSDDAHDVVQEVFHAVASGVARFRRDRPDATFRGWLWTIARHEVGRHVARRENRPIAVGGSAMAAHLAEIPEQPAEDTDPESARQLSGLMDRALLIMRRDFQERTWQAFWRTAIEGESAVDVGQSLGMTNRAVRQARHRVVRRLREEFRDLID